MALPLVIVLIKTFQEKKIKIKKIKFFCLLQAGFLVHFLCPTKSGDRRHRFIWIFDLIFLVVSMSKERC